MTDAARAILRARRRKQCALMVLLLALLATVASWRAYPPTVTDLGRYHQRSGRVVEVVEGDLLHVDIAGSSTLVRLLGCDSHRRDDARQATAKAVAENEVWLYLETVPTRNAAGELMAYVYVGDDLLNERLLEQGLAFADRRFEYTYRQTFERIEEQALGRRQGLWAGLSEGNDPPMPEWRRRWLTEYRKPPWERVEWCRPDEP